MGAAHMVNDTLQQVVTKCLHQNDAKRGKLQKHVIISIRVAMHPFLGQNIQ